MTLGLPREDERMKEGATVNSEQLWLGVSNEIKPWRVSWQAETAIK